MSPSSSPISLREKADLVFSVLLFYGALVCSALWAPFRGKSGASTYRKHVILAALRTFLKRPSVAQSQFMNPSTTEVYVAHVKKRHIIPETVTLSNGSKAHWIGSKNAQKLCLYFHGGGYCLPATPAHVVFANELKDALGKDAAVLFLSYTLAPEARYPQQLAQSVEALRYVVKDLNRDPSSIVLAGDSAGGALALGILSHLSHPHPVIASLDLSQPLGAAMLVSPWVSFNTTTESMDTNKYKDILAVEYISLWAKTFLGQAAGDNYNQAGLAPTKWWEDMKVGEVLITAGADEILIDGIRDLAQRIESVHPNTTVFIAPDEYHDEPILSHDFGIKQGEQSRMIKSWFSSKL